MSFDRSPTFRRYAKFSWCSTSWVSTIRRVQSRPKKMQHSWKFTDWLRSHYRVRRLRYQVQVRYLYRPLDSGQVVFKDSQNSNEEGKGGEVMVEALATNVASTVEPSHGRKKILTLAICKILIILSKILAVRIGSAGVFANVKKKKKRFNAAFANETNHLRNHARRCKAKYAQAATAQSRI